MAESYTLNGKVYEIESRRTEFGFEVQTLLGGRPVGPRYSVTYEVAENFHAITGEYWKEELTRLAKSDLDRGIVA